MAAAAAAAAVVVVEGVVAMEVAGCSRMSPANQTMAAKRHRWTAAGEGRVPQSCVTSAAPDAVHWDWHFAQTLNRDSGRCRWLGRCWC